MGLERFPFKTHSKMANFRPIKKPRTVFDTLALATGTRVGASDHAIALLVLNMVVSLGFVF